MKTTIKFMLIFATLSILMLSNVFATETGGSITAGSVETGSNTASDNISISAGNITEVNVSGFAITSRWAGFYGNIAGGVTLADNSNHSFYNWSVNDVSGSAIYAANGSISDWSSLSNATEADMPGYIKGTQVDSFNNTFNTSGTFNKPNGTNIDAFSVSTFGAGLETFALKVGSTLVWAGEAQNDATGFNGKTVDYQLLVPAQTDSVYYFYMELP